jgi:hypothetical protein
MINKKNFETDQKKLSFQSKEISAEKKKNLFLILEKPSFSQNSFGFDGQNRFLLI